MKYLIALAILTITAHQFVIADEIIPNLKNSKRYENSNLNQFLKPEFNTLEVEKTEEQDMLFNLVTATRGKVCMVHGQAKFMTKGAYRFSSTRCTIDFKVSEDSLQIDIEASDEKCNIKYCGEGGLINQQTFRSK